MMEAAPKPTAIPQLLNVSVMCVAGASCLLALVLASRATSWPGLAAAAVAFAYLNNTMFSLLHEATHGILHRKATVNVWMGRIAAAFFPTSFGLQRAFHLTHHKNNRTQLEQFDYLRAGDNRLLKTAQWYSIMGGLYWAFVPAACVVYFFVPQRVSARILRQQAPQFAQQTSAAAYLGSLDNASGFVIRLEILLSTALQIVAVWLLDLTLAGWLACYAAFGLNWSALQYADHVWSPLDVRNGAWNLRVNPVIRWLFLNYHYHLAHHQNPTVPWVYLPKLVDPNVPQPSFLRVWLSMWRGPRPLPDF